MERALILLIDLGEVSYRNNVKLEVIDIFNGTQYRPTGNVYSESIWLIWTSRTYIQVFCFSKGWPQILYKNMPKKRRKENGVSFQYIFPVSSSPTYLLVSQPFKLTLIIEPESFDTTIRLILEAVPIIESTYFCRICGDDSGPTVFRVCRVSFSPFSHFSC